LLVADRGIPAAEAADPIRIAAAQGAGFKEPMERTGHSSARTSVQVDDGGNVRE
jgi:hypothetical protein